MAAQPPATGTPARQVVEVVAPVFVLFGLAARIWMLATDVGGLDSDEAIVGLMARDILDGNFPMFYWGQSHGGPHEPVLTAAFFGVFGASTLVLKVVAILLSGAACVLIWRVGKRTLGEPAATAAALLFWVWPAAFVWWSVKSRGFYHAALIIGLASLLFVLRLALEDSPRDAAALGALVGTGLWCTPQTAFFFGPALLWLAVKRFPVVRLAPLGAAAAIVAAFPFWVHNLENAWVSFRASLSSLAMPDYGQRLRVIFEDGLPGALGLKLADGSGWVAGGLGRAAYALLLALFVVALVREVVARRRPDPLRAGRLLLLAVVVAYPLVLATSPYADNLDHPRYLYYLGAICALLLAGALRALGRRGLVGGLIVAMTLTASALVALNRTSAFHPVSEGVLIPENLDPLVGYLVDDGVDHVYADYWLAYYLAFESDERIVATPYRGVVRDARADALVRSHPSPGYLFVAGSPAEGTFGTELARKDVAYERVEVGGFVVYELERNLPPGRFRATRAVTV